MAQKIKYSESKTLLNKLEKNQLEYDFFGLSKNPTDCIYFIYEFNSFFIDFEVMIEEQKEIGEKFKKACKDIGYEVSKITYGNKPFYTSELNAPVYRINAGQSKDKVYDIGLKIINLVFGYNSETVFEVVP
ncbi:MAG: hypothetical protein IPH62_00750 [Ignavibacteriae bacterium]|nr:hypothetical protein [Ignavibacteriota bacterium]